MILSQYRWIDWFLMSVLGFCSLVLGAPFNHGNLSIGLGNVYWQHAEDARDEFMKVEGALLALDLRYVERIDHDYQLQLNMIQSFGGLQYSGFSEYQLPGLLWKVPFSPEEDQLRYRASQVIISGQGFHYFGRVFRPFFGGEEVSFRDCLPPIVGQERMRETEFIDVPVGFEISLDANRTIKLQYDFMLSGHEVVTGAVDQHFKIAKNSGLTIGLDYKFKVFKRMDSVCDMQWTERKYQTKNDTFGLSQWDDNGTLRHTYYMAQLVCMFSALS